MYNHKYYNRQCLSCNESVMRWDDSGKASKVQFYCKNGINVNALRDYCKKYTSIKDLDSSYENEAQYSEYSIPYQILTEEGLSFWKKVVKKLAKSDEDPDYIVSYADALTEEYESRLVSLSAQGESDDN